MTHRQHLSIFFSTVIFLCGAVVGAYVCKRAAVETHYIPTQGMVICEKDGSSHWSNVHFEMNDQLTREEWRRKLDDFCKSPAVRRAI